MRHCTSLLETESDLEQRMQWSWLWLEVENEKEGRGPEVWNVSISHVRFNSMIPGRWSYIGDGAEVSKSFPKPQNHRIQAKCYIRQPGVLQLVLFIFCFKPEWSHRNSRLRKDHHIRSQRKFGTRIVLSKAVGHLLCCVCSCSHPAFVQLSALPPTILSINFVGFLLLPVSSISREQRNTVLSRPGFE